MRIKIQDCEFLTSAVKSSQYPNHPYREIALVGRSNVGKSSLINAVVNRRQFARSSSQPGHTQTINFYRVDQLVLVDMPGYGFAKVPQTLRRQWQPMIEGYLTERKQLAALLLIVDIRHMPTEDDQMMANWIKNTDFPAWVVATKADKLSRSRQKQQLDMILGSLQLPGFAFSAATRIGIQDLIAILSQFNQ